MSSRRPAAGRSDRSWSLQARLGWRLAGVMLAAIALAGTAVAWRAIATVNSLEDQALQMQARDIRRSLVVAADGSAHVALSPELDAAYRYAPDTNLYVVLDAADHVVASSSTEAASLIVRVLSDRHQSGLFDLGPGSGPDGPLYGLVTTDGRYRVVVAQGRQHRDVLIDSLMQEFAIAGLWLLAPIGAAAVVVGVATIRRGLRSLTTVSVAAARIGPEQTAVRLPIDGLPREIRPLVTAVNSALDRLARAFEVQRRFTADAAHELRTPLAVLTARLDTVSGDQAADLRRDVDRMNRLVDQLLKIARLDGLPLEVEQLVNLRDVVVEAIGLLAPLAIRQDVDLVLAEIERPPRVHGNRPALVVAIVNLIENALAHSSAGSAVEVAISAQGAIDILDRGPGIPAAEREAIFQRFHRGRANRSPGAGLGLAIVAQIAAAHHGSVAVADRSGGGAVFTLHVPASGVA